MEIVINLNKKIFLGLGLGIFIIAVFIVGIIIGFKASLSPKEQLKEYSLFLKTLTLEAMLQNGLTLNILLA